MSAFDHQGDLRALAASQEPTAAELQQVRDAVLVGVAARTRGSRFRRKAGAAVVVAAAAVLVGWWASRPPGPMTLGSGLATLAHGVIADAVGSGVSETTGRSTSVTWSEGRIAVQVDPEARAEVALRTAEAVVRVRGTIFTVDRDRFATSISVARGEVDVECTTVGTSVRLAPGADAVCLRDAGAGLGRVLKLEVERARPEERLAALELALAHPVGGDDARAELRTRRSSLLADLAAGRLAVGDCDGAAPWLARLSADGDADAARAEAACRARPSADPQSDRR